MTAKRKRSRYKANARRRNSRLGLLFESLEDRRLLAVFSVSNLNDAGAGSLRDAITQANSAAGADEIVFVGAATSGVIALTSGELLIDETLTINGPGQDQLTIDAQQNSRVLNFQVDTNFDNTFDNLTLSGLTLTRGNSSGDGGGINFSLLAH